MGECKKTVAPKAQRKNVRVIVKKMVLKSAIENVDFVEHFSSKLIGLGSRVGKWR